MNRGLLRGLSDGVWPGPPPLGPNVVTAGLGGQFSTIQAAIDSIADSSATKVYTVLVLPGTYVIGPTDTDYIDLRGTPSKTGGAEKDYINLVGVDRDAVIITRPLGNLANPVIQSCMHSRIADLTLTSAQSRLIHWDTLAASKLVVDNVSMPAGGSGNGISTGVTGDGSRLEVTNCYIGSAAIGVHGGAGSATDFATLIFRNNVIDWTAATWLGLDLSGSSNSFRVYLSGNVGNIFNVDYSHAVALTLTEGAAPRMLIYTDFMAGTFFYNVSSVTKFWNRILFPQVGSYVSTTTCTEADCVAVAMGAGGADRQGQVGRVTTANTSFPAVVTEQTDTAGTSGWCPRLATGPYAEVNCESAGAVALGDILVTGTVSGQAKVNNAQTDPAKILGWATTTKAGATAGRVVVKLSAAARSW